MSATNQGTGAGANRPELKRPLAGVRVVDASHVFAIPYATSLLADLGAEVIKIQTHSRQDVMAQHGPFPENDPGERPWDRVGSLNTVNRGKLGLSLDIATPDGAEVFRKLAARSDIVAESFTPRVMKKLGLDYQSLLAVNPQLIMLSNTGYGHTGPWREYGSVATSLEGTSGMCWLSGYEDGAPSKIGQSYTDFIACWNAVYAMLLSLYRRRRTGRGQWIDLSMYQAGAATIGPLIMDYLANGRVATRMGNRHPEHAPHGVYPCAGIDRWVAIAIDSDAAWATLITCLGAPEWATHANLATAAGRLAHIDSLDQHLASWTRTQEAAALANTLQAHGIMAAVVETGRDLLHDEQLRARGFFKQVTHPAASGIGTRLYIGAPWKLSGVPDADRPTGPPAPMLGEHNQKVLTDLGYSPADIESLLARGVIGSELTVARRMQPLSLEKMRAMHRIGEHDPDYRGRE